MNKIGEIREKLLKKTREAVRERFGEKDVHVVRAVNALDELDRVFNQLSEQIIEWYSAHFPELARAVSDNEKFLELVAGIGDRKGFTIKEIERILKNAEKAVLIEKKALSSMGSGIEKETLQAIQELSRKALALRQERNRLAGFIEGETEKLLPNFSRLAGKLLAARMLKEAGSFKRLALMPSSTIQVLGAEKALFRHMRSGAKPPKHGLIFQHQQVQAARQNERGKAARKLAGRLSIAVKQDFFSKK